MQFAHRGMTINSWVKPSSVKQVNISEISGLLPSPEYTNTLVTSSLFINTPTQYDSSFKQVQVDALCNGTISPSTPEAAKRNATLIELHSLAPSNARWEEPVQKWILSPE
jgi:hypothetical protein